MLLVARRLDSVSNCLFAWARCGADQHHRAQRNLRLVDENSLRIGVMTFHHGESAAMRGNQWEAGPRVQGRKIPVTIPSWVNSSTGVSQNDPRMRGADGPALFGSATCQQPPSIRGSVAM